MNFKSLSGLLEKIGGIAKRIDISLLNQRNNILSNVIVFFVSPASIAGVTRNVFMNFHKIVIGKVKSNSVHVGLSNFLEKPLDKSSKPSHMHSQTETLPK